MRGSSADSSSRISRVRSSEPPSANRQLDQPVEALGLHRGDRLADVALLVEHGDEHADVHALTRRRGRDGVPDAVRALTPVHYAVGPAGNRQAPNQDSARAANVTDALVLCYHAVSPTWEAELSTTPERFARQLELLVRRGYRGATFSEAVKRGGRGRTSRSPSTTPTARCSSSRARSSIASSCPRPCSPQRRHRRGRRVSWPGIEQWLGGPHEHELTPMSWTELRSLAAAGWEIGSHTATHPHLTRLDDAALRLRADPLQGSLRAEPRSRRARPSPTPTATSTRASWPPPRPRAISRPRRCRSAWTRAIRSTGRGWASTSPTTTRRFRLKVSPSARRLRRSPAWRRLDALRRLRDGAR